MPQISAVESNIQAVRARMAAAATRAGREPESITLVAVTKRVDIDRISAAYAAGLRHFGESYVQEARDKRASGALDWPDAQWHFIGHLQSNKVRDVIGRYALIQSVHSLELAEAIGHRSSRLGIVTDVLIEVKLDPSASKAGVDPQLTLAAAESISHVAGVRLCGLMGMPPFSEDAEDARPHFQHLRTLFTQLPSENRQILSMGMTGDFEIAIEEGATMVRIGTGIFGLRQ